MRIYLDNCVFNRPFDDQSDVRISLETEFFLTIIKKIEKGEFELIISTVNLVENEQNPFYSRKEKIFDIFSLATEVVTINSTDLARAEYLESMGFRGLDALHIAVCEKAKVDYFVTCDDKLIKMYEKHQDIIKIKVVGILRFVEKEVLKWD